VNLSHSSSKKIESKISGIIQKAKKNKNKVADSYERLEMMMMIFIRH
jgi:hypothetical protein